MSKPQLKRILIKQSGNLVREIITDELGWIIDERYFFIKKLNKKEK